MVVAEQPLVSAIIVSHNTRELVRACLASLIESSAPTVGEVIVVDNASTDGSVEMVRTDYPAVRLLANRENVGFGRASNQGVEAARGEFALLLNSDTVAWSGAVDSMVEVLRAEPRVGLVGPRLLNEDGTDQRSAFRFPSPGMLLLEQLNLARLVPAARRVDGQAARSYATDWLSGACLLGRRALLRELGPFDRRFFMYGEDIDLCYRLRAAGWDIRQVRTALVTHFGGQSSSRYRDWMALLSVGSMYLFYRKHYGPLALVLANLIFSVVSTAKLGRGFGRLAWAAISGDRASAAMQAGEVRFWPRVILLRPPHLSGEADGALPTQPVPMAGAAAGPVVAQAATATALADSLEGRGAVHANGVSRPIALAAGVATPTAERLTPVPSGGAEPRPARPVLPSVPLPEAGVAAGLGAVETPDGPGVDERPSTLPSAARGSFALLASFLVTAVLNYAFTILMSWLLPLEQYGMLGVVQAILLLGATAVNAGFPWALAQAISKNGTVEGSAGAFRGALVGNGILGILIGSSLYGATWSGWLALGADYQPLMLVLSATIAVLAVLAIFAATLQGFLRLEALGVVRGVEVAVKFGAGALLVFFGSGALGAVAGFFIGSAVSTALAALLVRDFQPWRGRRWGDRGIYLSAGPFFLGMFGLTVLVNADIIGLKAFSPPGVAEQLAGHYQAALTLARIPIFLTLALFSAVFPYVAYHAARSERADIYAVLALKYTLLFIVPVDVIFAAEPDPIIRVFFSPAYDASAAPLAAAAVGTILMVLVHALAILLQASGRLWLTTVVLPIGVIVEIVALAWLVPRYEAVGAALSLIVAGLLLLAILVPVALRTYPLVPRLGATLAYLLGLGVLGGVQHLLPHTNRVETLGAAALAGLGYLAVLIVCGVLTDDDVNILASGLGSRWAGPMVRLSRLVGRLNLMR